MKPKLTERNECKFVAEFSPVTSFDEVLEIKSKLNLGRILKSINLRLDTKLVTGSNSRL